MQRAGSRRKIVFFRQGGFSHINDHVAAQLRKNFPELDLEQIDVLQDLIKPAKLLVARNAVATALGYGGEILSRKRTARECFYRTPLLFYGVKARAAARFAGRLDDYAFSIQTQSLYDASIPGLAHFLFTDHTHLANTLYPGFDPARLYSPRWIELEHSIYRNTRLNFVMGNHVRRSLIEHYGCEPARAVCIGVGSNISEPKAPLQNGGYANRRVLFVGIDWERKGGPDLVAAFAKVLPDIPDANLVIIGASPRIDLPNVEVLGKIPLEEMSAQYLRASVVCLPTTAEPLGINVIEAALYRLPVIASDIGAMPDILLHGESGLLVPPRDIPALAAALVELLSDPEKCRRFGERGYAHVKKRFTWDAVGARLRQEIEASLPAGSLG